MPMFTSCMLFPLQVNDTEVSGKSLAKAALVLGSLAPVIRLTVFRPPGVQSDCMFLLVLLVLLFTVLSRCCV